MPALEALVDEGRARALYLFPTKALAQDQLLSLQELIRGELKGSVRDPRPAVGELRGSVRDLGPVVGRFGTYDGDTSQSARARLRGEVRVLLTNPDILHLDLLPNHTLWANFFANLRFVVVDEAHAYRGVFGSHVGCVLRRLWRVCTRYGSAPQIIA